MLSDVFTIHQMARSSFVKSEQNRQDTNVNILNCIFNDFGYLASMELVFGKISPRNGEIL